MNVGVYHPFFHGLLCCLGMAYLTAGLMLTVFPSNYVDVQQSVTIRCENDNPNPPFATFQLNSPSFSNFCTLEWSLGGVCKNKSDSCEHWYYASCPSNAQYNIQVNVTRKWNGASVFCITAYGTSNTVNITVRVSVTSVTLTPTPIALIAGQQMNLTCTTSYSYPPANITWIKSSLDITGQSTFTTDTSEGLVRTVSSLKSKVVKEDNGKQLHCEARNTQDKSVTSGTQTLNVTYKPEVRSSSSSPYRVIERQTATLTCTVTDANPNTSITWRWIKTDSPNTVLHTGSTYKIPSITRDRSGSYSCTASNSVGISEAATINVDVQYKPEVYYSPQSPYRINEGQEARLTCAVRNANPNTSITWRWSKTDSPNTDLHDGPSYTIPNITRERSGSYSCTASNSVGTSEGVTVEVIVQYKPEVKSSPSSPYRVREGQTAKLECIMTAANPNSTISWQWFSTDSPDSVLFQKPTFTISNITKEKSGSYSCTATNSVGASKAATIEVDVQYKPSIEEQAVMIVNETERVVLTRAIYSNPLANVSWYDGAKYLKSEFSVETTSIIIQKAECADTKNFTLVASNALQWNVTSRVELIVNCKPIPNVTNLTLGVSDDTGFAFATTIIAYPKPYYELVSENRTKYKEIVVSMTVNAVNNFTVHFNKTTVEQNDYGTYRLLINNTFGEATVYVNVISQRKPTSPRIGEVSCNIRSAKIQWTSSFNGGDSQTFIVVALIVQKESGRSEAIADRGESIFHYTEIQNLQPSTKYAFSVVAQNKHGNSSSEIKECETLEDLKDKLPLIIGGATTGGVCLAVIVIFVVVLLRRYKKQEKCIGKSQRLDNEKSENEEADEDGMKENILYVSAGPRHKDEENPEVVVYAAVEKASPKSNNITNVYAEVKKGTKKARDNRTISCDVKPKRGKKLKKKQESTDGKELKKKQQEVVDVYENSENIAMTPNPDNVYSNAEHDAHTNQELRGYKNKDGLLYVEVQFDGKKDNNDPIIHGEDEKTDYATVEFPMPPVSKEGNAEKM